MRESCPHAAQYAENRYCAQRAKGSAGSSEPQSQQQFRTAEQPPVWAKPSPTDAVEPDEGEDEEVAVTAPPKDEQPDEPAKAPPPPAQSNQSRGYIFNSRCFLARGNFMNEDDLPHIPLLFGRFLIHNGLISGDDLRQAITVQTEITKCYACLLLEEGLLDLEQLRRCREYQNKTGSTLRETILHLKMAEVGALNAVENAVRPHFFLGYILVLRGSLSAPALKKALKDFQTYNRL